MKKLRMLKQDFPAVWLSHLFGFSQSDTAMKKAPKFIARKALNLARKVFLLAYLLFILIWFLLYGLCSFSAEVEEFNRNQLAGLERPSQLIVRILDEIPWVVLILRNFLVLALFYAHYHRIPEATDLLQHLLWKAGCERSSTLQPVVRHSILLFSSSLFIIFVTFMMYILYLNDPDLAATADDWNLYPLPLIVPNWVMTILLVVFTVLPYVAAQAVVSTIIGLGKGAHLLMQNVNAKLELLGEERPDRSACINVQETDSLGGWSADNKSTMKSCVEAPADDIFAVRAAHFEACHYVEDLTEKFSKIFLTVLAGDFAAAVGFTGLLIGYEPPVDQMKYVAYDHFYHSMSAILFIGFYLTIQYWPLVQLHEEAELTHHHVQVLSFVPDVAPNEDAERELIHFLIATKNGHVGVTAGKLFHFSRNLCVTMITLLCSYAVLVYELLHRDASAAGHASSPNNTINPHS